VRVTQIGEDEPYHLRGLTNCYKTRVQTDAYADRSVSGTDPYQQASDLATAINGSPGVSPPNGISGFRGMAGGSPPTLEILGLFRYDRVPVFEPEEFRLVRIRQDYSVIWRVL
jgi:hypothetical protein